VEGVGEGEWQVADGLGLQEALQDGAQVGG
jgi:hypothetical protein